MEKEGYDIFIVLRYIIYFLVAVSLAFTGKFKESQLTEMIIYLLVYIVNNQIRMYFLKNKKVSIMISIFIELAIVTMFYRTFGGFVFVYYFIAILDAALMLPKMYSYITMFVIYTAVMVTSLKPIYSSLQNSAVVNMIFNTVIVFILGGFGKYIQEERKRKSEAQDLYDKLRISEDNLKNAYEKLEEYSETIEELTVLRERNRISREIHDSVGHTLSTLIIQLQAVPYVMEDSHEKGKEMVNGLVQFTKDGLENVRRTVRELKPTDFDSYQGLFAIREMVSQFEKLTGVKVKFIVSKEKWTLNPDQSFMLYRILQELLSNALRHGKATIVEVYMQFFSGELHINVKDNGIGDKNLNKSFGLNGIEQRIKTLGGNISIETEENKGFEVNINIPKVESLIKE